MIKKQHQIIFCMGPLFMENFDLPKDYKLIRDVLPPNIL